MDKEKFSAIASRDLLFVSQDGVKRPMHVAVGRPYFPAEEPEMRMQNYAGCKVLTCDDPDLAVEVIGADQMEALSAALEYLTLFLRKLSQESGGELLNQNGTRFDPDGSPFFRQFRKFNERKAQ